MDVGIDAKSVSEAIIADKPRTPDEKLLHMHALAMRQYLDEGLIDRLYWFDTLDMLPDGMTKGSIERGPLIEVCQKGEWTISKEPVGRKMAPSVRAEPGETQD